MLKKWLATFLLAIAMVTTTQASAQAKTAWQFMVQSDYATVQASKPSNTYLLTIPRAAPHIQFAYNNLFPPNIVPVTDSAFIKILDSKNFAEDRPNVIIGLNKISQIATITTVKLYPSRIVFVLTTKPFGHTLKNTVGKLTMLIDSTTGFCANSSIGTTACDALGGTAIGVAGLGVIAGAVAGGILSKRGTNAEGGDAGSETEGEVEEDLGDADPLGDPPGGTGLGRISTSEGEWGDSFSKMGNMEPEYQNGVDANEFAEMFERKTGQKMCNDPSVQSRWDPASVMNNAPFNSLYQYFQGLPD